MPRGKRSTSPKGRSKDDPKKGRSNKKDDAKLTQLQDELETIKKERDEFEDRLAYMQAEFENLRTRNLRDVENRVSKLKECIFLDLLAVLDNFQRALSTTQNTDMESFRKGIEMISLQLNQVLDNHGLKVIATKGQLFDPFKHEAVEKVEDPSTQDNLIIEEVQRGFTMNGNVIRPSKVRVNVLSCGNPKQADVEKIANAKDVVEGDGGVEDDPGST